MNYKNIIAIDPGKSGGIVIYRKGQSRPFIRNMPETPKQLLNTLKAFRKDSYCFLEKVGGMPKMGGSSMFNFGQGYGHVEMALLALEIPVETITPQKWQKEFQVGTKSKCASTTEWKNKLKAKAQQLYPSENIMLWNADALLILHYGIVKLRNEHAL